MASAGRCPNKQLFVKFPTASFETIAVIAAGSIRACWAISCSAGQNEHARLYRPKLPATKIQNVRIVTFLNMDLRTPAYNGDMPVQII
jgi:hypothetical protein